MNKKIMPEILQLIEQRYSLYADNQGRISVENSENWKKQLVDCLKEYCHITDEDINNNQEVKNLIRDIISNSDHISLRKYNVYNKIYLKKENLNSREFIDYADDNEQMCNLIEYQIKEQIKRLKCLSEKPSEKRKKTFLNIDFIKFRRSNQDSKENNKEQAEK